MHPDRFVWLGGRLSLDFCNTRLAERELIPTPEDLAEWLVAAELADDRPEVGARMHAAALELRDDLRSCLLRQECGAVGRVAESWLDGVPGRLEVEPGTLRPRFVPQGCQTTCLLVPVVLDALSVVRDRPRRVRSCANEECPVLFEDTSRNGSRRWCSMDLCGSRSKSAAYYHRHRPAGEGAATLDL